jgi:hypothetical protein
MSAAFETCKFRNNHKDQLIDSFLTKQGLEGELTSSKLFYFEYTLL